MSIKLTVPERECPKCGKFFKPKDVENSLGSRN